MVVAENSIFLARKALKVPKRREKSNSSIFSICRYKINTKNTTEERRRENIHNLVFSESSREEKGTLRKIQSFSIANCKQCFGVGK
jgi:hypothetical protein